MLEGFRDIPCTAQSAPCDDFWVVPTVVIVDDHPVFRRWARRLLEEAGFSVVAEAEDGRSAVVEVVRTAPDLVLVDVVLPDWSGLEVADRIGEQVPSARVVLVSSRSREDLGIELSGPRRFVRKDELMFDRLHELLGDAE